MLVHPMHNPTGILALGHFVATALIIGFAAVFAAMRWSRLPARTGLGANGGVAGRPGSGARGQGRAPRERFGQSLQVVRAAQGSAVVGVVSVDPR